MHESAKVLIAVSVSSVLIGAAWGLQLRKADAENRTLPDLNMSVDVGRVLPRPSPTPAAMVAPARVEKVTERPLWKSKSDGTQYMLYDRNWTFFRSIDPITSRPIRQVCGYDAEWLGHRVCIGGPFNNVTFRAVNEVIDFDVFGSVPVEVRFETARGPLIRTYIGYAASQYDGIVLARDQVSDFLENLNHSRKTAIRFKLTEGFALITLTRYPRSSGDNPL